MKLLRVGQQGSERPALIDAAGVVRDLSSVAQDIDGEFLQRLNQGGVEIEAKSLPIIENPGRIGACVSGVGKFVCIGLNYSDHAAEAGKPPPDEPIIFMKAVSALCGPNDPIEMPKSATKLDWEVELGVVIGVRAKYVEEADALKHVAGYCTVNDVSERSFQSERSGQWTKGKSHDTFGPIGPWLVTPDEIDDPHSLGLWCEVDGRRYQNGSTSTMIFSIATIVSYLSGFMTLEPGDIIATGTPSGVGMGIKPTPVFLQEGQRVTLEVEGLGRQDHLIVPA